MTQEHRSKPYEPGDTFGFNPETGYWIRGGERVTDAVGQEFGRLIAQRNRLARATEAREARRVTAAPQTEARTA